MGLVDEVGIAVQVSAVFRFDIACGSLLLLTGEGGELGGIG